MDRTYIEKLLKSIKKAINTCGKKQLEEKLNLISVAADLLYKTSNTYCDMDLENELSEIGHYYSKEMSEYRKQDQVLFFYDGFGLDSRGLAQIYTRALCKNYKIIYIVEETKIEQISAISKLVHDNGGKVIGITERKSTDRISFLLENIKKFAPGHFVFYGEPVDVVATTMMYACEGKLQRYLINLTDQAFWLGTGCFDRLIEFRSFGANISWKYRKVDEQKIVINPFYPIINYEQEFQGFPFETNENSKVIFSGGATYKILGGANKYEKMVAHILQQDADAIFWYASEGQSVVIDRLKEKFPGRVFLTDERKDLYEIMKHAYFYLSTYPVCGGLMFQYAAMAGIIPLTLKNNQWTDDFLFEQNKLGIEFESFEEIINEINHLLLDENYCRQKGETLKNAVISQVKFEENVRAIMSGHATSVPWEKADVDIGFIQEEYMNNCTKKDLLNIIAKLKVKSLFIQEPVWYCQGLLMKCLDRMKKHIK